MVSSPSEEDPVVLCILYCLKRESKGRMDKGASAAWKPAVDLGCQGAVRSKVDKRQERSDSSASIKASTKGGKVAKGGTKRMGISQERIVR